MLLPATAAASQVPPTSTAPPTAVATPAPSAPSSCARPEYRQFDFWLGDWDVYRRDGQRAGRNRVEAVYGGCAVRESWEGNDLQGSSYNIFDRESGRWHQTWVDGSGLLLRLDGGLVGHEMVLRGEAPTWGRPGVFLQEIRWTPRAGGELEQTGRLSEDGGKTWTTLFDLVYRRRQ
jgi:hypothetical protein